MTPAANAMVATSAALIVPANCSASEKKMSVGRVTHCIGTTAKKIVSESGVVWLESTFVGSAPETTPPASTVLESRAVQVM